MSNALQSIHADLGRLEQSLARPAAILPAAPLAATETLTAPGMLDSFKQALQAVDEKDRDAGDRIAAVDSGRSDDLVGAMLASNDASLSFSMLMQVRNKVAGAFDELIKLPL